MARDTTPHILEIMREAAVIAGRAILEVYGTDFAVDIKEDKSPLTQADRAAHQVIAEILSREFPDIPLLSEEGRDMPHDERRSWKRFFCVDPLDGTKEFVSRNGEFCVNIALVRGADPALGVVNVPVRERLYWGGEDVGAFRQEAGQTPRPIATMPPEAGRGLRVVASRSHPSPELKDFLDTITVGEMVSAGSALKLCLLAEGSADIYPRFNPTMEWDIAAGHAILEAAGGSLSRVDGSPFVYNKPDLRNPGFIARGWRD